jgi:hypothetical protein
MIRMSLIVLGITSCLMAAPALAETCTFPGMPSLNMKPANANVADGGPSMITARGEEVFVAGSLGTGMGKSLYVIRRKGEADQYFAFANKRIETRVQGKLIKGSCR